jgi:hypothetical protein
MSPSTKLNDGEYNLIYQFLWSLIRCINQFFVFALHLTESEECNVLA